MYVAQIAVGYSNREEAFDDEAAAERWLAGELARYGTKFGVYGVVFEVGEEAS